MQVNVFYTDDGKMYKAVQPKSTSHAKMNFPEPEYLKALTEIPCTREEMLARINHPEFNK